MKRICLCLAAVLISGIMTGCASCMTIRSAQDIQLEVEPQPAELEKKGRAKDDDEIFQR